MEAHAGGQQWQAAAHSQQQSDAGQSRRRSGSILLMNVVTGFSGKQEAAARKAVEAYPLVE